MALAASSPHRGGCVPSGPMITGTSTPQGQQLYTGFALLEIARARGRLGVPSNRKSGPLRVRTTAGGVRSAGQKLPKKEDLQGPE
jgi:hypothetical protein